MIGPPSCTGKDLQTPRLRRFPLDPATLVFKERIDGGLDGYVWKVCFGDAGPFALKVVSALPAPTTGNYIPPQDRLHSSLNRLLQFWDAAPPEFYHYYAPQRECHNAAVLQMMAGAVASGPVLIYNAPETKEDALSNFLPIFRREPPGTAVCRESRDSGWDQADIVDATHGAVPRLAEAQRQRVPNTPSEPEAAVYEGRQDPEVHVSRKEYIALVYELVEDGENMPAAVEEVTDFLWCAGFSHTLSPAARNWKSGVLVDLGDIVHAGSFWWKQPLYGMRTADRILLK